MKKQSRMIGTHYYGTEEDQNNQTFIQNTLQIDEMVEQKGYCKICYDSYQPLLSICNCSGSIRYVHRQCVIQWIIRKLQQTKKYEIPECQVCHTRYFADIQIGQRKLSPSLLCKNFKKHKKKILIGVLYFIGIIVAVLLAIIGILDIIRCIQEMLKFEISHIPKLIVQFNIKLCIYEIFPYIFSLRASKKIKKRKYQLIDCSTIQTLEINFHPKNINQITDEL